MIATRGNSAAPARSTKAVPKDAVLLFRIDHLPDSSEANFDRIVTVLEGR